MNIDEIIKGLEFCSSDPCGCSEECPYWDKCKGVFFNYLVKDAIKCINTLKNESVIELVLKGFIKELINKVERIEHSASNTYYSIVYLDDIYELAKKYGIKLD